MSASVVGAAANIGVEGLSWLSKAPKPMGDKGTGLRGLGEPQVLENVVGFEAEEGSNCRLIAEEQGAKRGHPPSSRSLVIGHWGRFKGKFEVTVKAEATETGLGHPEKHP